MKDSVIEALYHIPPERINRTDWVKIGMALKAEGYSCDIWDQWSSTDKSVKDGVPHYKPGETYALWALFRDDVDCQDDAEDENGKKKYVTRRSIKSIAKRNN